MRFTAAIATAIIAYTNLAVAAPAAATQPRADAPPPPALSLTQQLFLADTAVDRFALLPSNADFLFDFSARQPNPGAGGELVAANRKTFPALVGTSAGMAVGRVRPCGVNTLHVHPRGAELQLVVEGRLVTEMVPENGVVVSEADGRARVVRNTVGPFQMTPFYQGSVHAQFNPDCDGDAVFVAAFSSDDFGAGQVVNETVAMGDEIVLASFGPGLARAELLDGVRAGVPKSIALGVEACLKKCGIGKR